MWVEFLVTSFIVVIAPGTGAVYTIGIGLSLGAKASLYAALGCTFGILPHMAAAIFGVAALLQASPSAFFWFKFAGVAYLLYLAWSTLNDKGALTLADADAERAQARIVRTGFLINILNPKLSIFFLAFLPQFMPDDLSMPVPRMLVLSGVFMAMTLVVFVGYGAFAGAIRQKVLAQPGILTWLRRAFALAFALLAVRLLLEQI